MDDVLSKLKNVREFLLIFVGILLLSFHYFFVYFINSTYLSGVLNEGNLGYVYTAGAVLNITLFLIAPKILKRFGNYKLTLWLSLIELVALLGLAAFKTPLLS
jgi:Na+/melibiose symporter-like transporter